GTAPSAISDSTAAAAATPRPAVLTIMLVIITPRSVAVSFTTTHRRRHGTFELTLGDARPVGQGCQIRVELDVDVVRADLIELVLSPLLATFLGEVLDQHGPSRRLLDLGDV